MNWFQSLQAAISYIEKNILNDISIEKIAENSYSSSANFQRIFSIITGMTIGDYIRNRRLTLAGEELYKTKEKIIDVAMKYKYETAESFTKAFLRFHGVTPSEGRRNNSKLKHFFPLSINIDVRGGFNINRKFISNVPVIHYDGNNAGFYITLLTAALQSLGEECDRAKLTALSGIGNRFCWEDGKWVFGNELLDSINEMPFETESRILNAIGWKAKYITVQRDSEGNNMNIDRTQIRRDFIESIDKGFPVIARYVEHPDCNINLFFGYEEDGQKVICYPYNNGFEPGVSMPTDNKTPVAKDNWEDNIAGYILFQGKEETASVRNAALSAFKWISKHARRTTEINGKLVGFAAWESYLYHLEQDDFTKLSFEEVKRRFFIYCDGLCQIYERNQALDYFRLLAEQFPEWRDELETAYIKLKACADYGGYLWKHGFTFDDNGFEKFRIPEARKMLADAGREALQNDIKAVEHFEKILQKEKQNV